MLDECEETPERQDGDGSLLACSIVLCGMGMVEHVLLSFFGAMVEFLGRCLSSVGKYDMGGSGDEVFKTGEDMRSEQMSWDEYFCKMAEHVKEKSKDRSTKCGSVIASSDHAVLSVGFNGFPRGVNDNVDSRHERPAKYSYTEHGERNAIYNAARHGIKLEGATIYLSGGGLPCDDCARAIIQAGIVEVVSLDKPFEGKGGMWEEKEKISAEMFKEAGVRVIRLNPDYTRKD